MKPSIFLLFLLFLTSSVFAQDMHQGVWLIGENGAKVKTYMKDGEWFGKLVSSDNPKAPIGTDILRHFKLVDGVWKGQLYAIKRDKLMDATIQPSNEKMEIKVSVGFFSKTLEWKKDLQLEQKTDS
jgi:hypothetical protein